RRAVVRCAHWVDSFTVGAWSSSTSAEAAEAWVAVAVVSGSGTFDAGVVGTGADAVTNGEVTCCDGSHRARPTPQEAAISRTTAIPLNSRLSSSIWIWRGRATG